MELLDFAESIIERRQVPIIFAVETSQYMTGCKIEVLNDTLKKCIALLKQMAKQNTECEFYIAVVTFSTTAEWQYNRFVPIEEYEWLDVSAGGDKNIGQAYTKVHQVLSDIKQLGSVPQVQAPLMVLLSNKNEPDDYYQPALDALKKDYWFERALKLAVVIQNDFLEEFTNSKGAIITDSNILQKIIRCYNVCDDPEAPCSDSPYEPLDETNLNSTNEEQNIESISKSNDFDDWD